VEASQPAASGPGAAAGSGGRSPEPPAADPPGAGLDLAGTLDEDMLPVVPMELFDRWMGDVLRAGLPEPTAMLLATVSADQRPRARMVLLKDSGPDGFTFYTNRTSRKARDLADVPQACLVFPWYALHRQVIVEGSVAPLSTAASEPYFHSRPRGSQLGAWASRQSTVLASRADLEDRYAELERRWPEGTLVPMPEFWGGYQLRPERMEFWQGRISRLHDRFRYTRHPDGWQVCRLAP
jgi:pyridoxamine 5'-phosphate oxidase